MFPVLIQEMRKGEGMKEGRDGTATTVPIAVLSAPLLRPKVGPVRCSVSPRGSMATRNAVLPITISG